MGELLDSARQSRIISKFFTLSVQNVGTAFFARCRQRVPVLPRVIFCCSSFAAEVARLYDFPQKWRAEFRSSPISFLERCFCMFVQHAVLPHQQASVLRSR